MPSKKQRRRREKTFRHEYETVLLDADGNEIPLDPDELRAEREAREAERAKAKKPASGTQAARGSRSVREVAPPSWQRAIKRGGTMGAVMLLAFIFLFKNAALPIRLAWGAFYAVAFIPLTYWIDRTAYRTYQRRAAKAATKKA
jgi:hypothetical protein